MANMNLSDDQVHLVERLQDLFMCLYVMDKAFLMEYYGGLLAHGLNTPDHPALMLTLNQLRSSGGEIGIEAEHLIVAHGFARVSGTVH
jgi:hypothetical protein